MLLNNDPNINGIAKFDAVRVEGPPGTFVGARFKWRGEIDLDGGLCSRAGRVERDLVGRVEGCTADMFETIVCVPVACSTVLNKPLLVYASAEGDQGIVGNREI